MISCIHILPVTLNTRITVPLSLAVAIRVPEGENWIAASWPECAGIIEVDACKIDLESNLNLQICVEAKNLLGHIHIVQKITYQIQCIKNL